MKQIRLKSNFINIPIVDDEGNTVVSFKFEHTDEALKAMEKRTQEVALQSKDDTNFENEEKAKDFIKNAIDLTFGEGSFDKLYNLNPSISIVSAYFFQMCLAVSEEMDRNRNVQDIEKYLKG